MRLGSLSLPLALLGCGASPQPSASSSDLPTQSSSDTSTASGTHSDSGSDTSTSSESGSDTHTEAAAEVRFAHFGVFPGRMHSGVDLHLDETLIHEDATYLQTFGTTLVDPGTYEIRAHLSGSDGAPIAQTSMILDAEEQRSIVLIGYQEDGLTPPLSLIHFVDDHGDELQLRLVHAAPLHALEAVDIWRVDEDCEPIGSDPLVSGLDYSALSTVRELPTGSLGLALDLASTDELDGCFLLGDLHDSIDGGGVVNLYAINDDNDALSMVAHLPDGTPRIFDAEPSDTGPVGFLRFVNAAAFPSDAVTTRALFASPDLPPISLALTQTSNFVSLPVGPRDITVEVDGDVSPPFPVDIEEGSYTSLALAGAFEPDGEEAGATLLGTPHDTSGLDGRNARFNITQAHPGPEFALVDLLPSTDRCDPPTGPELASRLPFAGQVRNHDTTASTFGFLVRPASGGSEAWCFRVHPAPLGEVTDLYLFREADGELALLIHPPDDPSLVIKPDLVTLETEDSARMRYLHLGVPAETREPFLFGIDEDFVSLSYEQGSDWIERASGAGTLSILNDRGDALVRDALLLEPETATTIVSIGYETPPDEGFAEFAFLTLLDEPFSPDDDSISARVVHAAAHPKADALNVYSARDDRCLAETNLVRDLSYTGDRSVTLDEPVPYLLVLDGAGSTIGCYHVREPLVTARGQSVHLFMSWIESERSSIPFLMFQYPDGELVRVEPEP
ncbi:MAG: DUF4397 domain-containing protein [Deltaproteobacteria bacterium]|nr:MAG: DUF4397 domain-containing protein [Deltaproteobacteria bacterium]